MGILICGLRNARVKCWTMKLSKFLLMTLQLSIWCFLQHKSHLVYLKWSRKSESHKQIQLSLLYTLGNVLTGCWYEMLDRNTTTAYGGHLNFHYVLKIQIYLIISEMYCSSNYPSCEDSYLLRGPSFLPPFPPSQLFNIQVSLF